MALHLGAICPEDIKLGHAHPEGLLGGTHRGADGVPDEDESIAEGGSVCLVGQCGRPQRGWVGVGSVVSLVVDLLVAAALARRAGEAQGPLVHADGWRGKKQMESSVSD